MGKMGAENRPMMKLSLVSKSTRGHIVFLGCVYCLFTSTFLTEDNCTFFQKLLGFGSVFEMKNEMDELNKALETGSRLRSDAYMKLNSKGTQIWGVKYYASEEIKI